MSEISFAGQCVIVTGAGGGLGRTYAIEIARRGGMVVVNDTGADISARNASPAMADAVVKEIRDAGGQAVASYDTVATTAGANAIARAALDNFGRIDGLINNAGTLMNAWFQDFSDEARDEMLGSHLLGNFNVTRAVWPTMIAQGYGRVLFVASAVGAFGNATQAGYGAAKGGIIGLMNTLSQEGRAHNIMCNALLPNAASRMGEAMIMEAGFDEIIRNTKPYAGAITPEFVTGIAVYLVSNACATTHDMYSALGGRIARAFIGVTEGWLGPRDRPATVDEIAAHIGQIRDVSAGFAIPASLADEMRLLNEQIARSEPATA